MRIGILKEIKENESRVSATPASVSEMVSHGHEVLVEAGAGAGSGFADDRYRAAGADVRPEAGEMWGGCELSVNTHAGQVTHPRVADALEMDFRQAKELT